MTRPPVDYIERTRAQYEALGYPPYDWVSNTETPPFVPMEKPLSECRLTLIASGGIYRQGQVAFHFKDDFSFRAIGTDTKTETLRATHFAYDLSAARKDPNSVFPLDTLRTMVANQEIAALGPNAYTFMGGIYSTRKVAQLLAPAIADRVVADQVDLALLVPV